MKSNPICYLEIPAPKFEPTIEFYRSVFNWKIEESNLTQQKYSMFTTGEKELIGGFDEKLLPQNSGIIPYIKVDNISETLDTINKSGGSVLRSKFEIGGGFGFSAIFIDPSKNHIGLWADS